MNPHDDGERLDANPKESPALPTAKLVRAARIRNGLRVDLTAEEWAERAELVDERLREETTPERRTAIARRLAEIDHGHRPAPVPKWAHDIAGRKRTPAPLKAINSGGAK